MERGETPFHHRVLLIFPYDWTTSPRSFREVHSLRDSGYEIATISTDVRYVLRHGMGVGSSPPLEATSQEIRDYRIPFFAAPLVLPKNMFLFKICFLVFYGISALAYSISLFFLTLLTCITQHVSLIHVHNAPDLAGLAASLVSRVTGIPYVYEIHDLTPELYAETMNLPSDSIIFKLLKKVETLVVSNSTKNIFVSRAMQDHFESTIDLNRSSSMVMYSSWSKNFLDIFKYTDSELDRLLKENSLKNKFIILYLGSMEDGFRRGLDLLVESMKHLIRVEGLRDIELVFVGNGASEVKRELQRLVKDYQLEDYVRFTGKLPRYEAYRWLRVADVAVDPLRGSASTEIAVSNKLLEYMAAGKAIIASDLIGHREVLKNGYNGLSFKPNDPMDLASKVSLLVADTSKEYARKLGLNARKAFCEKYSWENQRNNLLNLYHEILQGPV